MEFQDAEKVACSSKDVIEAVTKKLKFYLEVRRREDGFDTSPSYIPRKAYPNLLPRPMLMTAPQDVPMKHHFSHARVRSAMARLQSYQPHKPAPANDKRGNKIRQDVEKHLRKMRIDHPMWFANREYDVTNDLHRMWLKEQAKLAGMQSLPVKRMRRPLRNGVKTIVRAPPPYVSAEEKERLISSTCGLILGTENIATNRPNRYMEVGNTKLQSLDHPTPLQFSFMADIHQRYVRSTPRYVADSAIIKCGKNRYVYDLHGRRNKVVILKEDSPESAQFVTATA
ncbi:uncharacterized protein LOC120338053 [Styela clava]